MTLPPTEPTEPMGPSDIVGQVRPPSLPDWITPRLVADTVAAWRAAGDGGEALTPERAVALLLNCGNLFAALGEEPLA